MRSQKELEDYDNGTRRNEERKNWAKMATQVETARKDLNDAKQEKDKVQKGAIVKQKLRQNAIAIKKIHQYDEMTKRGITIDSYERAKAKADNYDNMSSVWESVWPGLWNAVQVIINPRLDRYVMNDREKELLQPACSLAVLMLLQLSLNPVVEEGVAIMICPIAKTSDMGFIGKIPTTF